MSWTPLVKGESKIQVISILEQIPQLLSSIKTKDKSVVSLMEGTASSVLFLKYWSLHSHIKFSETIENYIEEILSYIGHNQVSQNFLQGLSGFGWMLNHLAVQGYNPLDVNSLCSELDQLMIENARQDIKQSNFDFFYGVIGVGMYFVSRSKIDPCSREYLIEIAEGLFSQTSRYKDNLFWDTDNVEQTENIELGLAHGQAMVLAFLIQLIELNILTEQAISYGLELHRFFQARMETKDDNCIIPDSIENGENIYSPLRWCHGHLGIALTLYRFGKLIERKDIVNEALSTGKHAASIKSNKDQHLRSTILCHGTIGVAHMFNRFYQYSGERIFKSSALFWYEEGLAMINDSKIHLRKYFNEDKFVYDNGIVSGVQGIGLALIASISSQEPAWDSCMLLS